MKSTLHKIFFILVGIFCLADIRFASAQYNVGDYGTITSGDWNISTTWGIWNGASFAATASFPSSANNTHVRAGHTVQITASPMSCSRLRVEAGAKLWTASSSNFYLYVYGDSIVCNGQIGNGGTFDGLSFGIEGASCLITGTGTFDASRMRKNLNTPTTNLTIARDVNLRWNAVSTTQLYNVGNNTNFNVTVNTGCVVNLIPSGPSTGNVCIDGIDGAGVGALLTEAGGTFTINGTLIISGKLYLTTNNSNPAYGCNWIINGLVQATEVVAGPSGTALHTLTINNGGKLEITGTPAFSGLSTTNNSYTYNNGSTVEYSAAGAQNVRVASEFGGGVLNRYYNLIMSGSGLKSTTLTNLYARNDLTITGSAVLDPNPTTSFIFVGGNWYNYNQSGFNEKTTDVRFNGTLGQSINCPGGEIYYTLRQNNGTGVLTFNCPVDVQNTLGFSTVNGIVDLNSNTLTIINPLPAGISGFANNRYILSEKTDNSSKIKWKIGTGTGTYTFPFGYSAPASAASYIPVVAVKSTATTIGDLTLSTYGTAADNLPWPTTPTSVTNLQAFIAMHNVPDNRHWTVDRFWEVTSTSPTTINSLTFSYRAIELPDSDLVPANLQAQFWSAGFGYWYNQQYGLGTANSVTVSSFSIYNTAWTLTSITSPLPIELLSFQGKKEKEKIVLEWTTASEINNNFFTVEKSLTGKDFYSIGELDGAHNSTEKHNYTHPDLFPANGINYYRLKQTDFDGTFTYSKTIAINYEKRKSTAYNIFPNPGHDILFLTGNAESKQIIIRDAEGREISSVFSDSDMHNTPVNIDHLPDGIYFLEVRSEETSEYLRFIKN